MYLSSKNCAASRAWQLVTAIDGEDSRIAGFILHFFLAGMHSALQRTDVKDAVARVISAEGNVSDCLN
jgi:hypothetical protein